MDLSALRTSTEITLKVASGPKPTSDQVSKNVRFEPKVLFRSNAANVRFGGDW